MHESVFYAMIKKDKRARGKGLFIHSCKFISEEGKVGQNLCTSKYQEIG